MYFTKANSFWTAEKKALTAKVELNNQEHMQL